MHEAKKGRQALKACLPRCYLAIPINKQGPDRDPGRFLIQYPMKNQMIYGKSDKLVLQDKEKNKEARIEIRAVFNPISYEKPGIRL